MNRRVQASTAIQIGTHSDERSLIEYVQDPIEPARLAKAVTEKT
jgi:hypothetical protein